jgi:hypothetical protein
MKRAKQWIGSFLVSCCVVLGSTPVLAYVGVGPCVNINNSNLEASAFIDASEIDYKFEIQNQEDADIELERKFIGLGLTKKMDRNFDIYGAVGYLFDGSLEPEGIDGYDLDSGYFLSAGARYMMHQSGSVSFHIFGQLDYILEEEYADNRNGADVDFELDGYEISLGAAIRFQINDKLSTFAGLSFVPFSEISYDFQATGAGGTANMDGDVERDDNLGFKAGASYIVDSRWSINGEADFVSDSAFVVSASMKF